LSRLAGEAIVTRVFRADQVGSLLRPVELLEARAAHAQGRLPLEELRAIETAPSGRLSKSSAPSAWMS